ncbi:DUF5690 family protein [Cyclobacterium qasimii]|uniref:MFS transporter n=2 Tax=Cyclobacterium qasimii TaxID=1350429 RepID=S7VH90_9BACT|nr:DUF5690 family protein [Cyclobacterium qasimii]EPR69341.1 hypothetical protein ADICYQ_1586 [Cyclobacterium qasimii M12-11B]GEO22831.1 hypothetical protein CQA01_33650 [Cyclobacterium qasimii]
MSQRIKVSITKTDVLLVCTAFMAYTGMYAVRKSFLAGQFEGMELQGGFHFKTLLIISQVLGYMLSKFIGIRLVPEIPAYKRFGAIVGLVGFGLLMLLAFAYVPVPLKPVAMFLNGLPLGMIFGLVLVYLEGRKNSELLVAGLSATFIFSTGLVKSTGIWLMQTFQVSELMMPFVTGAIFFPMLVLAAYGLNRGKPPTTADKELRTERLPMDKNARMDFMKKHGLVFLGLVLVYVVLTVVRDFRDNFIVEFWAEFNMSGQPELITLTEIPIAVLVLIISALGILVLDNKKAFLLGIYATIISAILMIVSTFLFTQGTMGPVFWMISSGFSVYLPYILFHCLLFERLIAFLKYKGTVGFLFYVADALGYLASVGILIYKEFLYTSSSWVEFFTWLNLGSGALIVLLVFVLLWKLKAISPKVQFEKLA